MIMSDSIIIPDYSTKTVVWRLSPEDANKVAEFLENNLLPHDYGQLDAEMLRSAAFRVEHPPAHFDHSDTATDAEIEHDLEHRAHYDGLVRDLGYKRAEPDEHGLYPGHYADMADEDD